MCGLVGFSMAGGAPDAQRETALRMLDSIAYRGPDERGTTQQGGVVLGHNRLTIMEPQGGRQPRVGADSGNALIYNGEIYSHRQFDAGIVADGGQLRDHCDTETLFWLLQQRGIENTLEAIDGMFAFAWYDAGADALYLARDRFGQKPIFYSVVDGQLIFASEIKALRQHPALARVAPDLDALALYLMMEYLPGAATGIDGVFELPAGHLLEWRNGAATVRAWWRPDTKSRVRPDMPGLEAPLEHALVEAVGTQLVADVPVGVFLSGGLDSSLVAAIARRHKQDVATFTVRFPFASFDESAHAEKVAAHIGTRHTTVELGRQNCIDGIETLLANLDQPFADSSFLPSYLLCRATKEHVTVALGGDGADELFLGYPNFGLLGWAPAMARLPRRTGRLLRGIAGLLPGSDGYMNTAFLLRQLSYGIGRPAELQSPYWMSAVPAIDQSRLWQGRDDVESVIAAQLREQIPGSRRVALLDQCQQHFIEAYLAHDILTKMDRASMCVSLEVRSPFLANDVADIALRLPHETLLQGRDGKLVLRRIAASYLPDTTIARKKHGFALPVAALLRGDLRDLAAAILLDRANPMYAHVDHATVDAWWRAHVDRGRDHGKRLWALLMLAAFYRNQFA
ncbi:MAG: asparagine synthase (glutamine-hydrolyzing) [Woeseiaceae bacterium]|nr:asparagine synthase (glutamine-hydrolyzing) [Woeseiaceae bacterium]